MTLDRIAAVLTEQSIDHRKNKNHITVLSPIRCSLVVDENIIPNVCPVYIVRDERILCIVMDNLLSQR